MKHVIVGVGAAGISAAAAIKRLNPADEIVMISADDSIYSRCMLHLYISGKRNVDDLSFVPEGFFENNKIEWISGKIVEGVDVKTKSIYLGDEVLAYDRLLIATGSRSFFPPIIGIDGLKNVHGLRDISDVNAIKSQCVRGSDIIIAGAGLVGMDAAYAFTEMNKNGAGLKPLIVDPEISILPFNLDADAARLYMDRFENAGCTFRLGRKVVKATGDDSVKSVILDNSEELPCNLLIVAAGVRPNTDFLEGSGIELSVKKKAVVVDRFLATNADGVFAAGDVTGLSEDWSAACTQGETAGMNMCGDSEVYDSRYMPRNTINYFDIPSLSLGQVVPKKGDEVKCRRDRKRYEKIILRDGIPVGVVLRGDISNCGFWQHLIKNNVNISHIPKPIWKLSFADAYGLAEDGEYEWVIG